jgi:hypothetical protein
MRSCILISLTLLCANCLACTDEYAPVCGYWMHSPRTQTYPNRCKMLAAGAKLRHEGSCRDQPVKNPPAASGNKNSK